MPDPVAGFAGIDAAIREGEFEQAEADLQKMVESAHGST
jgi:hypothetical protein